jgi:hypothetical protein
MLALRCGERALPLAWRVEAARSASRRRCSTRSPLAAQAGQVRLLGDRFYGTADLIGWCQQRATGCA